MTILEAAVAEIGSWACGCWWRRAVKTGPGALPRRRSQVSRAASGHVVELRPGATATTSPRASWSVLDRRSCSSSPPGLRVQVGQGQGGELAGAQRGGVAEQDEGAVAGAGGCARVDRGGDGGDLGQVQGVGRVAGGGAQGAAQAAAHLTDDVVADRVGQAEVAMVGADRGAGQLEGGDADALVGARLLDRCARGADPGGVEVGEPSGHRGKGVVGGHGRVAAGARPEERTNFLSTTAAPSDFELDSRAPGRATARRAPAPMPQRSLARSVGRRRGMSMDSTMAVRIQMAAAATLARLAARRLIG